MIYVSRASTSRKHLNVDASKLLPLAFLSRFSKAPRGSGPQGGECPGLNHGGSFLAFPPPAWQPGPQSPSCLGPGGFSPLASGAP